MMKEVMVNKCMGGFEVARNIGMDGFLTPFGELRSGVERDDSTLVSELKRVGTRAFSGQFAAIWLAEVPEKSEAWWVEDEEDNGYEQIVAVVNGKEQYCSSHFVEPETPVTEETEALPKFAGMGRR